MIHMLSCFNLLPEVHFNDFCKSYHNFTLEMKKLDLLVKTDPIGKRVIDTPMDTDNERDHKYFTTMSFRDREQLDLAYAHILRHIGPSDIAHSNIFKKVQNPVFICWQDLKK